MDKFRQRTEAKQKKEKKRKKPLESLEVNFMLGVVKQ